MAEFMSAAERQLVIVSIYDPPWDIYTLIIHGKENKIKMTPNKRTYLLWILLVIFTLLTLLKDSHFFG
jgi:hypothetical protein